MKTKGYSSAGPVVRSKDEIQVHPRLTQSYLEEYHNNYDVKLSQAATIHDWQFNKCEREVEDYVCRPKGNQPDVRFSVNYLQSPLDQQLTNCRASNGLLGAYLSPSHTFFKEQSQKGPSTPYPHKDRLGATHRGTHRFVPRHSDEMVVEIGDSIHVLDEAEDGWCMGINLTSQVQGLFPSVYATDLKFYEVNGSAEKQPSAKLYKLHFLGSMEVNHHKGSDVLVDAIEKIIINRRLSKDTTTPPLCQLEVSDAGIKMIDLTHKKRTRKLITDINVESASERLSKLLAFSKETKAISNHFFSLKNVSFCGYHPDSPRYFGFITKHPTERRFACHCYSSVDDSTQEIVDAVGDAFQKYYCGHIPPLSNSSEDFYFE
ncbi:JNK-interacting protein 1-like [Watersipora subatra]|uniref:JNK-interacting protein 1-like n=1 Tax=Watersipora subatra TaxID=2589382 RepID=UPI00355BFA86